jgi:phosphate transport system substrate-binding protein
MVRGMQGTLNSVAALALAALVMMPMPVVVEAQDNDTITWAGCGITRVSFMQELADGYTARTGMNFNIEGGGATRGIRDTAKLNIDIGGSCRITLPDTDSSEMHVTLHPVAWDALAIILHPDNPVDSLDMQQVRDIYDGRITNWKEVGGLDAPLNLMVREGKISGVGFAIRQYIFEDGDREFITDFVYPSSGPLEQAVEKDVNAIGITGVSSARKRNVKIIGFDGMDASFANVRDGNYGLYRPLFLVSGPRPSPKVREFIAYATSEEGKQILRDNEVVPYHDALHLVSKMLIYGLN